MHVITIKPTSWTQNRYFISLFLKPCSSSGVEARRLPGIPQGKPDNLQKLKSAKKLPSTLEPPSSLRLTPNPSSTLWHST